MSKILPVILSGGSGTRLWPLSTPEKPKQFLNLVGEHSLLQMTALRFLGREHMLSPLFISSEKHRELVKAHAAEIDLQVEAIILEPVGRNTAPAVAIAALYASLKKEDPILLILPSDHLIKEIELFYNAVCQAMPYAEKGGLITFGVVPTRPETGYGYIHAGEAVLKDFIYHIDKFVEKPDLIRAEEYLKAGGYYWNSGMFMGKASTWLKELALYEPEMLKSCQHVLDESKTQEKFIELPHESFQGVINKSIDHAVLEKTQQALVIPVDIGWSDIGSWQALMEVAKKDENGNVVIGDVRLRDILGVDINLKRE